MAVDRHSNGKVQNIGFLLLPNHKFWDSGTLAGRWPASRTWPEHALHVIHACGDEVHECAETRCEVSFVVSEQGVGRMAHLPARRTG